MSEWQNFRQDINQILKQCINEHSQGHTVLQKVSQASETVRFTKASALIKFQSPRRNGWISHWATVTFDMGEQSVLMIEKEGRKPSHNFRFTHRQLMELCNSAIEHFLKKLENPKEQCQKSSKKCKKPNRRDLCSARKAN